MPRLLAAKLMVLYLMVLFALTLGGFYRPHSPRNFVPFRSIEHDVRVGGREFVINFVGNIVVTVPMGLMLPSLLGRCSTLRVAGVCLALSSVIEILQGISGRRVADVDDVILNTLGGVIGWGLWVGGRWLFARSGLRGEPAA